MALCYSRSFFVQHNYYVHHRAFLGRKQSCFLWLTCVVHRAQKLSCTVNFAKRLFNLEETCISAAWEWQMFDQFCVYRMQFFKKKNVLMQSEQWQTEKEARGWGFDPVPDQSFLSIGAEMPTLANCISCMISINILRARSNIVNIVSLHLFSSYKTGTLKTWEHPKDFDLQGTNSIVLVLFHEKYQCQPV